MSWVAEQKAITQKHINVVAKKPDVGSNNPTNAIVTAITICIAIVQ